MRIRLSSAALAATLAACTSTSTTAPGASFAEPAAVAVFRGVTAKAGLDPASASTATRYRPWLAVANAGSNDLSILDALDGTLVTAPVPLRGLVYPVPGRPVLLVSADLGDGRPDLLAVVTAGDLPWLGGSRLEVVRTWAADGAVVGAVDLGADILAVTALPFDPAAPGRVTVVAALAGEKLATVTFARSTAGDGTAVDVAAAQATVATSAALGFQPLDLAVIPGERARVFAATSDPLPGPVHGVAQIALGGATPFAVTALDARAPTRLVAAARLTETAALAAGLPAGAVPADATAFDGQAPVNRVYAVLDESGCGLDAEIACGLVALDPDAAPVAGRGSLLADPTPAGSKHAPFRAPLPFPYPLALGASGPPLSPPSAAEPQFAGTFLRVAAVAAVQASAVAGLATADGALTFVDLSRWEIPTGQSVFAHVTAKVSSTRPAGTTGTQFLTLVDTHNDLDPSNDVTVLHTDPNALTTSVQVTGGYTPADRWTVTHEGVLPGLSSRRAEPGTDGSLALQVTAGGAVSEVVRLWDPTLGVQPGDLVVIDPSGLGTCTRFEAAVAAVQPPTPARPGGYVTLAHRTPAVPAWDACVDAMIAGAPGASFLATFRAADYVLVRGTGAAAVHVGRPVLGQRFEVAWQDEAALAAACPLPPAVPWQAAWATTPPGCDETCRAGCALLQRARLARRIGYVVDPADAPADLTGPALGFTLALQVPSAAVPRDLALVIDTADGRAPFRVGPTVGSAVDPRQVVPFDRSPWAPAAGVRFLVPYAGNLVLDATPTVGGGGGVTMH